MKPVRILFIIFTICFTTLAQAQDYENIPRSNVIENIGGKDYYLHKVSAGQTLYAIAMAYHVKVEDIMSANYGLTEDLKPGQYIKIPASPRDVKQQEKAVNLRRVSKGETIYGLAREYNVSVEEIRALNDGLTDELKEGMLIKLPVAGTAEPLTETDPQQQQQEESFEYQAKSRVSLYELAVKYRVSIDSIYALNPGIDDQLRNGQIIRIPVSEQAETFITHKVRDRQTLNRLSRKYDIDIDRLKSLNPYISRHLQKGQVIRIPLPELTAEQREPTDNIEIIEPEDAERLTPRISEEEHCAGMMKHGEYRIALMLPLFYSVMDSLQIHNQLRGEPEFIKPFAFIQFYEGFMMAVDSLKKLGLNADIYVYNVEDDVFDTKQLLRNPELKRMDLIIGPVYSTSFKIVAEFAREHEIHIVNPLSNREEIIYDNPFVFKVQPTIDEQFHILADFLNTHHGNSQIFLAKHNEYRNALEFGRLKSTLNNKLNNRPYPFTTLYHEIIYMRDSLYTFMHNASTDHDNVVVTYSENNVFIFDIFRNLNELRDTFNITVVGMPRLRDIEDLELEYLNNLNTHMFADDYVDYGDPRVRNFVRGFRQRYATEPVKYAFEGYDTGMYFLSALMKFGDDFGNCIGYYDRRLLNSNFNFERKAGQGFRNVHWKLLEMRKYNLREASRAMKTMEFLPE
ncbi:MAG: LysM peptidoglycan-binding domain-containing protein, partial [Bacteroidales bacterium]